MFTLCSSPSSELEGFACSNFDITLIVVKPDSTTLVPLKLSVEYALLTFSSKHNFLIIMSCHC